MDTSAEGRSAREGHRLIQAGLLLFLYALLVGLAVQHFAIPRLGLSTHLLGIMQGLFLVLIGLVWPRLRLTPRLSRAAAWLAVYGCLAPSAANLVAAIWGAGHTMLPIAAGEARGSPLQEGIITVALRTGAASLIATSALVLWGLRLPPGESKGK